MSNILSYFCMPGGHSVEYVADPASDLSQHLPPGWALVKASVIPAPKLSPEDPWSPGIWYADPESPASVLCCPEHALIDVNIDKKEE